VTSADSLRGIVALAVPAHPPNLPIGERARVHAMDLQCRTVQSQAYLVPTITVRGHTPQAGVLVAILYLFDYRVESILAVPKKSSY
jgi:hypothetical protein